MRTQIATAAVTAAVFFGLIGQVSAAVIFTEDFESLAAGTYVSNDDSGSEWIYAPMGSDWTVGARGTGAPGTSSVSVESGNYLLLNAAFSYENGQAYTNEDVIGVAETGLDYILSADVRLQAGDSDKEMYLRLEALDGGSWTTVATTTVDPTSSWVNYSVTADTATMSTYVGDKLRVWMQGTGGTNYEDVNVDNILVEAVPEPASLALLMLGGIALAARRRGRVS